MRAGAPTATSPTLRDAAPDPGPGAPGTNGPTPAEATDWGQVPATTAPISGWVRSAGAAASRSPSNAPEPAVKLLITSLGSIENPGTPAQTSSRWAYTGPGSKPSEPKARPPSASPSSRI